MSSSSFLLEAINLQKYYPVYEGIFKRHVADVKAVESVDLQMTLGKTIGLVGESGCGKSTLSRLLLLLESPTQGKIQFQGMSADQWSDQEYQQFRKEVQVVFQNPFSSLNPRMTIGEILADPLYVHTHTKPSEEELGKLLHEVGMSSKILSRFPHEFSGGQRQRIGIARALSLNPSFLICDEAVSALDVSVQAQILNLLVELQEQRNLGILFISHDLGVVHYISDQIAVMYLGQIVEFGEAEEIFQHPKHPYTQTLLHAEPKIGSKREKSSGIAGELPSSIHRPSGCFFHPRCPMKQNSCTQGEYPLQTIAVQNFHATRCRFHDLIEST